MLRKTNKNQTNNKKQTIGKRITIKFNGFNNENIYEIICYRTQKPKVCVTVSNGTYRTLFRWNF